MYKCLAVNRVWAVTATAGQLFDPARLCRMMRTANVLIGWHHPTRVAGEMVKGGAATFVPGVKGEDFRYERAQARLVQSLSQLPRVSLRPIKVEALHPWISRRLTELVGIQDEVLEEFVFNTLAERQQENVEAGEMLLLLVPFMGKEAAETFVGELWSWIERAQASPEGVPAELWDDYEGYQQRRAMEIAEQAQRRQKMSHLERPRDRDGGRLRSREGDRLRDRNESGRVSGREDDRLRDRVESRSGFRLRDQVDSRSGVRLRDRVDSRSGVRSRDRTRSRSRSPSRERRRRSGAQSYHRQSPSPRRRRDDKDGTGQQEQLRSPPRDSLRRSEARATLETRAPDSAVDHCRRRSSPPSPQSSTYSSSGEEDATEAAQASLQLQARARRLMEE